MDRFRLAVFNTQPPYLYFGGVERRIIETAKRLQTQADIKIYSGTKAGFKEPTTINGVSFVPFYSTDKIFPLDNWFFNRSLSKKVREINAEIYEAHAVSGYGFPQKLKKMGINKPFIHTIHGVLADEYEQAKKNGYPSIFRDRIANYFMHRLANLEAETARHANLIVTISNYSFEKIQKHYGIDTGKVRIVPNGVDTEKFKPTDPKAARQQFRLGNEPCMLFVGSLIPRKGVPFLVEAAKKIIRENAETKFLIVGEGPLKNQLIVNLKSSNLFDNFKFLGNLKEDALSAAYNCADVFVLPSIQEGQGIVLLEAQASGKPVVAFDVGGVNEAMQDGETGLLVDRGNTDELADALLKLLGNGALREKMGANGRRFVSENFTWDICADKMLEVYHEALGN